MLLNATPEGGYSLRLAASKATPRDEKPLAGTTLRLQILRKDILLREVPISFEELKSGASYDELQKLFRHN